MKVLYNIKNARFYPIDSIDVNGTPKYGEMIKMPGTVSLALDPEGSSNSVYADGIVWYSTSGSTTYSGTFENFVFNEEVLEKIFSYKKDSNGNLVETDGNVKDFGMQCSCDSDEGDVHFSFFKVSASRTNINLQTKEGEPTINPTSVSITISPITLPDGLNVIKSMCRPGDANYATYLDKITLPTFTTDTPEGTTDTPEGA